MSRSLNKVQLIGFCGQDPEVKTTQNGGKVANVSLATSESWNDQAGNKQERTEWSRLVIWDTKFSKLAEIVEKYVKKGDQLYVEGKLETREWTDKEGVKRCTTEIKVRELITLGSKNGGGADESTAARNSAPKRSVTSAAATSDNFEDFPTALQDEEDDMPF